MGECGLLRDKSYTILYKGLTVCVGGEGPENSKEEQNLLRMTKFTIKMQEQ